MAKEDAPKKKAGSSKSKDTASKASTRDDDEDDEGGSEPVELEAVKSKKGEPDDNLGLDLPPWRKIGPKPGQLVLFPSWMWHGTRAFRDGARLTVAFDVMPPY